MPIEATDGGVLITGAAGIDFFRLCALRGALKLQKLGMTRRGPSALSIARKSGFKGSIDKVLSQVQAEIDRRKAEGKV
jgi:hypothetical protein